MDKIKSYQLTISGRVQNVGFRYHTYEKAILCNIKGFVKNLANGNVYCEAEGEPTNLNEFIAWCHKGPNWATVLNVIKIEQPVCGYDKFEIKR